MRFNAQHVKGVTPGCDGHENFCSVGGTGKNLAAQRIDEAHVDHHGVDYAPRSSECRPPQYGSWLLCDAILGGLR